MIYSELKKLLFESVLQAELNWSPEQIGYWPAVSIRTTKDEAIRLPGVYVFVEDKEGHPIDDDRILYIGMTGKSLKAEITSYLHNPSVAIKSGRVSLDSHFQYCTMTVHPDFVDEEDALLDTVRNGRFTVYGLRPQENYMVPLLETYALSRIRHVEGKLPPFNKQI